MTQKQRLLEAFRSNKDLMVYQIMAPRPQGLGIAQYNARIKELREDGYEIKNIEPGRFRMIDAPNKYENTPTCKLENLKQTAEAWLASNQTHTNYAEALRRYEQICDELTYRQAKESLL